MKRLKIISDVVTSRGVFLAGADVVLEDVEADSCIKNGRAELISATAVLPAKPVMPPNVVEKPGQEPKKKF